MKVAIVGQQDFGKAVLEAFLARKDQVAGVFCAPEKPGARPDALAYVTAFLEKAKNSGVVRNAFNRAGLHHLMVAP